MADKEEVVTGSEAAAEAEVETEQPARAEEEHKEENRIPISRAEDMWKKREEKLRKEWEEKELGPAKKQLEDFTDRLTKAELERLKAMGWYKEEPEKPLTRDELNKMLEEREAKLANQWRVQRFEDQIRAGWAEVAAKHPKLAGNKHFQDAALSKFAKNPNLSLVQHADMLVKELLETYSAEKSAAREQERERQLRPDRRVVPSGRGGAGGSGGKEEKKSVADRIKDRLKAAREG